MNINNIVISVIMPVYNAEKYLNEAVDSILNQSFTDFEFFIIDDCSTDKSRDIIRSYNDARIVFIEKPVNSGYTDSLNMAIPLAKGKYIARMDADDISMPERLEKQFVFMEKQKDVVVCGTWFELMPAGLVIRHPTHHDDIKLLLLKNSAIGHPTAMIRKSTLTAHKLFYDKGFEPAEDYELWTRMLTLGSLANIPQVLLKYREHGTQVSTTKISTQLKNAARVRIKLFEQLVGAFTGTTFDDAQRIFGLKDIKNSIELKNSLDWLTSTIVVNKEKLYFKHNDFCRYVQSTIVAVVRNYYLNKRQYNPLVLIDLLRANKLIKEKLSVRDKVVIALKSLILWKR